MRKFKLIYTKTPTTVASLSIPLVTILKMKQSDLAIAIYSVLEKTLTEGESKTAEISIVFDNRIEEEPLAKVMINLDNYSFEVKTTSDEVVIELVRLQEEFKVKELRA